jgi:hydrogenase maturation protease
VTGSRPGGLVTLVGGVGELYQRDLDVGRLVLTDVADLAGGGVYVEDLSYGAIPFTHRLMELRPDVLVLVGAVRRGRRPGSVARRVVTSVERTAQELQGSVRDAYVGYVDLDLAVEVAYALGPLPRRTVLVEVEPSETGPGDELTPVVRAAVPVAAASLRDEVALAPLFDLHATIRERRAGAPAGDGALVHALDALVAALDDVDATSGPVVDAGWGRVYAARDQLQRAVAMANPDGAMEHTDWGLLWAATEELDRRRGLLLRGV